MDDVVLHYVFYRGDKYDETHFGPGLSNNDGEIEIVDQWYTMTAQNPRFDEFLARGGISWVDVPVSAARRLHLRFRQVKEGGIRGQNMALGIFYTLETMRHIQTLGDLSSLIDEFLSPDGWNTVQNADLLHLKIQKHAQQPSFISKDGANTSENFCYGSPQELHGWLSQQFPFTERELRGENFTRDVRKDWFWNIGVGYNPPKSQKGIQVHAISKNFYLPSLKPWSSTDVAKELIYLNPQQKKKKMSMEKKWIRTIVLAIFFTGFGTGALVANAIQKRDFNIANNHAEVFQNKLVTTVDEKRKLQVDIESARKELDELKTQLHECRQSSKREKETPHEDLMRGSV